MGSGIEVLTVPSLKRTAHFIMKKLFLILTSLVSFSCFAQITNTNITILTPNGFTNFQNATLNSNQFTRLTSNGIVSLYSLGNSNYSVGNFNVVSNLVAGHFVGTPGNPPTIVLGISAGTSASYVLNAGANDNAFIITVNTGSPIVSNANIFSCTFTVPRTNNPVVISDVGNTNAFLSRMTNGGPFIDFNTIANTGFNFLMGTNVLKTSSTYVWQFHILE